MNKFGILRKINQELKYISIDEYIGLEVPIDISNSGTIIADEIKLLIEDNLNLKVKSIKDNNIKGTIAKYGMIDVNFEIEHEIEFCHVNGIQILRENGWAEEEDNEEHKEIGLEFIRDMISEIAEGKTYLKIHGNVINQKRKWFREKTYLVSQMLRREKLKPKPEDRIQIFKIDDMCYTNYSGIWLWKHFYM